MIFVSQSRSNAAPKPKPAPKKEIVKKEIVKKESKTKKQKSLIYNERTLQLMFPQLAGYPMGDKRKYTLDELTTAYQVADKVLTPFQAREWKEKYEDKYKKKVSLSERLKEKKEPKKEIVKKEPKKEELSDRLKKFNIEVMQYLNKVNERKVKSMDQNKREKTALINFVEKNAPNSKVLQIENSPVVKDNRKFYVKGPKRFIFSKSVDKKTIDFIENKKN
jgi:vacuolar-type H+-ATPase subunit I/STV1